MSDSHLLETVEDGVATLTLNRPSSLNALSGEMMDGLLEALPRLAADPAVRVLVLTGAGKAFCAGGDVKNMDRRNSASTQQTLEERAADLRAGMEASRILHTMSKPTVAKMRGAAAGAGFSLALACDLRYASEQSKFTTAFAKVGFSGDYGGSYFLPRLVGQAKARELFFTARVVSAEEAERLGIVNALFADEELDDQVNEIVRGLAAGPAIAYRYMKRNLNASSSGASIEEVFDLEAWHMTRTGQTEDHKNAAKAFVEKRMPVFEGR